MKKQQELKTVKMERVRALIFTNLLAVICIAILNYFLGMNYTTEGSFDVLTGAFIEVLILSAYFEFLNHRSQKNMELHLQDHLRKIENLIKDEKATYKK